MEIKLVSNDRELYQILQVQQENHLDDIGLEAQEQKGFVTVRHDIGQLRKMNDRARQVIAVDKGQVVGYALVMLREFHELVPVLQPMFEVFRHINYRGTCVADLNYYVMGQICVANSHKRQGILRKLYEKHREVYADQYDYLITEVSSRNVPSLLAHQKVGFKIIYSSEDSFDHWNILLWDWH